VKLTFQDPDLVSQILDHPYLNGLTQKGKATTYFQPAQFARALVSLIWKSGGMENKPVFTKEQFILSIKAMKGIPESLREMLLYEAEKISEKAENYLEIFENRISGWFDSIMERLSSRFRRWVSQCTLLIATILTLLLNADTISIANYLYSNPDKRAEWASQAFAAAEDPVYQNLIKNEKAKLVISNPDTSSEAKGLPLDSVMAKIKMDVGNLEKAKGQLEASLPLGWKKDSFKSMMLSPASFFTKLGGWIITILAICLGSPFWFDILSQLANIRNSIKPKTDSQK
jgi:hypothetical protein